jgi:DNA invertase Pin-like site-specific DNA recombinase
MSPMQVPPSAARAGVETKPAAKRITKAKTGAGLARARQSGTKLGRRKVRQSVEATIREQRAKGDGILKIARTLGVGTSVVERVVLEPT